MRFQLRRNMLTKRKQPIAIIVLREGGEWKKWRNWCGLSSSSQSVSRILVEVVEKTKIREDCFLFLGGLLRLLYIAFEFWIYFSGIYRGLFLGYTLSVIFFYSDKCHVFSKSKQNKIAK